MKKNDKTLIVGDVVLFYQNLFPAGFLQILEISDDIKPGWYKVRFAQTSMGGFEFYWILDENHLNQEDWTMNGIPCRLQLYGRAVPQKSQPKSEDSVKSTISSTNSNSLFGDL